MRRAYPEYAIGAVGAVLVRDNKILLVKRGSPPAIGKWSLPGGVIEPGERIGEAARRELWEETGLRARPLGVLWLLNNIVLDRERRVKYRYIIIDVLFDPGSIEGDLTPGSDAVDAGWFNLRDVSADRSVSRTVSRLARYILEHGLNYIPLVDIDNVTMEIADDTYKAI